MDAGAEADGGLIVLLYDDDDEAAACAACAIDASEGVEEEVPGEEGGAELFRSRRNTRCTAATKGDAPAFLRVLERV